MRVFELTSRVNSISRGDGRSATAAAAYRACFRIDCEREGRSHDYSRKGGLEAAEIVLPKDAPDWAKDRARLWNAVEMRERNKDPRAKQPDKMNARPARELMFTFPAELSAAGRLAAARIIARYLSDAHRVAADFSIHQPGKNGDQRNFHCHLMWTSRRLDANGFGEKAREWDELRSGTALVKALRQFVASTLNDALEAEGKASDVHVEHRSFKERGEPDKPTRHQGPGNTNKTRKAQGQARDAWRRETRAAQDARHGAERAGMKIRQDAALSAKLAHLAEQERRGIETVREKLRQDQAADKASTGFGRIFERATGQAMRTDFERQQRSADRVRVADRTIEEFQKAMQAERAAYVTGQQGETKRQAEDHRRQNDQLKQATAARHRMDLTAEAEARRDQARGQQRTHDHGRSRDR